jgi:two-component system, OmpR family, sensor histidine kinase BaeS
VKRPSLGTQIGLGFAAVAALTALVTAVFVYSAWQNAFESYVRERVQADAEVLADLAATTYSGGDWQTAGLIDIARLGARNGLRVQVISGVGVVLVDNANLLVNPMMSTLPLMPGVGGVTGRAEPMHNPVVQVPVLVSDQSVGSVRVASSSPGSFLTDRDLAFRTAALGAVALAAVLAVVLAAAGGFVFSRAVAGPIVKVTRTAAALRAGRRDARTGLTGDDEIGVLGHTLDQMADSIEAEREFERRLTADVAHELRTPLQAVQATVEAMQDGVMPADPEHLQTVRDETVRLGRLADTILELSRLENRTIEFHMEDMDPAMPLTRAVETHRALFDSLDLALVRQIEDGGTIEGDDDRLVQAFSNLLSNAAHYTPEGGSVTVGLRLEPGWAVVWVSDTGIGVPEEDRERVFSRFWRGTEARERSRSGFGIGLSVVREIVEVHGGTVSFAANEPGPGTTFVVRLPLVAKPARTAR